MIGKQRKGIIPSPSFPTFPVIFKVEMQNPKDGQELDQSELKKDFTIRFAIDTSQGKDLDSVSVLLDGKEQGNFCYGGIPGQAKSNTDATDGTKNGITPKSAFKCEFVCLSDFSNLSEGEHEIMIKMLDVKENPFEKKFKFIVKKDEIEAVGEISYESTYYTGLEAVSNDKGDCGFEVETTACVIKILKIT